MKAPFLVWLGYCDSNTGMSESESDALPLGDTPIIVRARFPHTEVVTHFVRTTTAAWRYHNINVIYIITFKNFLQ